MGEQLPHRSGTKGGNERGDIRLVTCHQWNSTGLHLSHVLFIIFINYLDTRLEQILSKVTDYTNIRGAVDSLKVREALQRDLSKLDHWAITNHMKFNKGKWQILLLGPSNPGWMDNVGNEMLESSTVKRDLGVLVSGKLNMSQQCPGSQEGQACPGGLQG
ncbi:hypothetical protein TURU_068545 [Turdus rufiventris]|nr:hypothetical protein TURU_068545 [Turdus rufiventris]